LYIDATFFCRLATSITTKNEKMKTTTRLKIITGLALFLMILATSCSDNNKDTEAQYNIGFGVIKGTSASYTIVLDNKTILYPQTNSSISGISDGLRVAVEYSIISQVTENGQVNYNVTLYNLYSVLTENPIQLTHAINDTLGADPINIASIWSGGKYLNVDYEVWASGTVAHSVNLAIDSIQTSTDTVRFILKHNAFKDTKSYSYTKIVSFDMSNYIKNGKTLNMKLRYSNYFNADKEIKFKMKADSISEVTQSTYSILKLK